MRIRIATIAVFSSIAVHAQALTNEATTTQSPTAVAQPVQETPPPDPFSTEECNLACQIARMQFTPGGGSGLSLGKEAPAHINGLELGIERPSAEQLRLQMPAGLNEKLNIQ